MSLFRSHEYHCSLLVAIRDVESIWVVPQLHTWSSSAGPEIEVLLVADKCDGNGKILHLKGAQ